MFDRAESSCRATRVTDKQVLAAVKHNGLGQACARGARQLLRNRMIIVAVIDRVAIHKPVGGVRAEKTVGQIKSAAGRRASVSASTICSSVTNRLKKRIGWILHQRIRAVPDLITAIAGASENISHAPVR